MQLAYLESVVQDWRTQHTPSQEQSDSATSETPETNAAAKPSWLAPVANLRLSTVVKSALAIAVAVMLGWVPTLRLLATTSAEAVVNARVVTLRAPIEGDVTMAMTTTDIGSKFQSNQEILTIRNPRADYSHLDNLRRERDQLNTAIAALNAKKELLAANLTELSDQQENFRVGRIAQLEQRVRETEADIAATQAKHDNAAAALKRASALRKTDDVSQAFLDKALQDEGAGFGRARRGAHGPSVSRAAIAQAAFFSAAPGFIVLCSTESMDGRS